MRCRRVQRRLSAFQDGELEPETRVKIEAHLEGCLECRRRYQQLEGLWRSLGALGQVQPSAEFYSRLAKRIEGQSKLGLLNRLRWAVQPFSMALPNPAVLILGILAGVYLAKLLGTLELVPLRSGSRDSLARAPTLLSLKAFDPMPPGTLAERYLRAACDLKDGIQ